MCEFGEILIALKILLPAQNMNLLICAHVLQNTGTYLKHSSIEVFSCWQNFNYTYLHWTSYLYNEYLKWSWVSMISSFTNHKYESVWAIPLYYLLKYLLNRIVSHFETRYLIHVM